MTKIYVRNLEPDATHESVRSLFATYGSVDRIRMRANESSRRPFAFVEMGDAQAIEAIQGLHGADRDGESLHVVKARPARKVSKEAE